MDIHAEAVQILLLGPVRIRVGPQQQDLQGRRQQIAVARLALAEGRPVPVSALIDDLWTDKRPKNAVHAVQAHMHRLRALLPVKVEYINDGYRLADRSVRVDAKEFSDLCERGRTSLAEGAAPQAAHHFERALEMWRGPALSDLEDVPGLRPFALQLTEMRRSANVDRGEALLQCGRGASLIAELRATLAVDPLQETSWHQLMRALWHEGREAEALAAYGRAREAFIDVLGAEPGTKLAELHAHMLQGTPPPATPREPTATLPAPSAAIPTPPSAAAGRAAGEATSVSEATSVGETALVGRDNELTILEQAWARSAAGLQVVTLSGEPGIGKTTVAEAWSERVNASHSLALHGRCDPSLPLAYRPFAQLLEQYLDSPATRDLDPELLRRAPELARVLPELTERIGPIPVDTDQGGDEADSRRTMDAIASWLSSVSADQPLLIQIDDVHWADEQTLLTLRHLLHSPRRINALIVLCVRDGAIPVDETHPLSEILRQSERVTHLPLTRLADDEAALIVSGERARLATPGTEPTWVEDYVLSASGGNPLFVVELTRQLLVTRDHPGGRDNGGDDRPPPPAGIMAVILSRVDGLPAPTRLLLQTAAVIGTEFSLAQVAAAGDVAHTSAEATLAPAREARLVETPAARGGDYQFSHDIVRAVLYESLPATDRASMHGHIAALIEADQDMDVLRQHQLLAHHYGLSTMPDAAGRAATHLHRAGNESLARGALADAERLFTEAMNLLHDNSPSTLRCDMLTALGTVQLGLARPEYRATLLEASRLAVTLDDVPRLTAAVLANTRGWWSSTVAVDHERVAHIETALARTPDSDLAGRGQLLITWALENVRDVSAREAVLTATQQACDLVEASGDDHALATLLSHQYAVLYALFESPTECLHISERLLALASRYGSSHMRLSATLGLTQSSMRLGEFAIADRYLTEAAHLSETLDDPARQWLVRGWQAMRAVVRGKFDVAEELILETFELGTRTGQADAFTWFAGQLFTLRMLQGRLAEIEDQVRAQADVAAEGVPSWKAALALALARTGHFAQAEAILDEFAADSFAKIPRDMLWLNGLHYFTMTCDELGRADVAATLYGLLLPFSGMVASNGTIGAGPVDLHLGVLARLQGQYDVAERHLRAAATLCRRIDAPVWLHQTTERLTAISRPV